MADSEIERIVNGECVCGHGDRRNCLTCSMTAYMVVSMRQMLGAMFPPKGRR